MGKEANKSGSLFEYVVKAALEHCRIKFNPYWKTGVYDDFGVEITPDFFLPNIVGYDRGIYLECRRQRTSGSASDKCMKLLHNIRFCYDRPTIVIFDGRALDGMRVHFADYVGHQLAGAYDLSEFIRFIEDISGGDDEDGRPHRPKIGPFDPSQGNLFANARK